MPPRIEAAATRKAVCFTAVKWSRLVDDEARRRASSASADPSTYPVKSGVLPLLDFGFIAEGTTKVLLPDRCRSGRIAPGPAVRKIAMKTPRIERQHLAIIAVYLGLLAIGFPARTQDSTVAAPEISTEDLAKKLQNPIAALISVPFQNNFDFGLGPSNDGFRYTLNVQPVIPISLNKDWNLISRTILPIISQHNAVGAPIEAGGEFLEAIQPARRSVDVNQDELGDMVQSFFLSPVKPGPAGLVWGVGPVFLLPTATDDLLGSGKWGAGPTAILLKQTGGWTFGFLANHIWSFAGDENRSYVSTTFVQPFLSFTTRTKTTFGVNTESSYD